MKNRGKVRIWVMVLSLGVMLVVFLPGVSGAIPQKINYQGYLTSAAGVPVNGTVQMVFSIYNVSSGGSALWAETQNVTVNQGAYSVNLGDVFPIPLPFDVQYYLGIRVGDDPEMMPRKILTSVGYAFRALTVSGQASPIQNPRSNTLTTIDSGGFVGEYTAITIGTDGLPVISYYDGTNGQLKFVHCGNPACSLGNMINTVDSGGVGKFASVTIGAINPTWPLISYYDETNKQLKFAHCTGLACITATRTTIDSGDVGTFTSITIGTDGLPVISYSGPNGILKVAHCSHPACLMGTTITTVDSDSGGLGTSITIGTDGLPVISYNDLLNGRLKVAHCGDSNCSTGNTITTVDSGGAGNFTSITIGTDSLPVISYYDMTNGRLKVAHCGDSNCSTGNTITTVDSGGVGGSTSITIGTDGLPVISYFDMTNYDLKVAKCANPFCLNYWSRR